MSPATSGTPDHFGAALRGKVPLTVVTNELGPHGYSTLWPNRNLGFSSADTVARNTRSPDLREQLLNKLNSAANVVRRSNPAMENLSLVIPA